MEWFELSGKTFVSIKACDDELVLMDTNNVEYKLQHYYDCCETMSCPKVEGAVADILNKTIVLAEDDYPADPDWYKDYADESHTWSRFALGTADGSKVTWWFLGQSNGYYGETMTLSKVE